MMFDIEFDGVRLDHPFSSQSLIHNVDRFFIDACGLHVRGELLRTGVFEELIPPELASVPQGSFTADWIESHRISCSQNYRFDRLGYVSVSYFFEKPEFEIVSMTPGARDPVAIFCTVLVSLLLAEDLGAPTSGLDRVFEARKLEQPYAQLLAELRDCVTDDLSTTAELFLKRHCLPSWTEWAERVRNFPE